MKICEIENCTFPVFSKGKCKIHQIRTPLKKGCSLKPKSLKNKPKKVNIEEINQMNDFFKQIWLKRPHRSEISNDFLGDKINSMYFHHVLLKSDEKYGDIGRYDEENIILLTPEEHGNVHIDMYRYEKINQRREILLKKYDKILNEKVYE
jgi:hypothetical protein